MNKKILISILLFAISYLSMKAQILDNKIDLSLSYGIGIFGGDEMTSLDGFVAPSLYSNYDNLYGISFKGILLKKQHFSFGASLNYSSGSEWNAGQYTDYINSGVLLFSFSPLVQIHNRPSETGFFNRFRLFLDIAPTIGLSKLSLSNPLFDIQNGYSLIGQPTGSNDMFYGLKGTAGIQASVNQLIGVFLESSAGYYLVISKLYADSRLINYNLEAGVVIKLKKNKRYFY
jgi:hypothetical protein